jgi:hypothetical protein
MGPSLPKTQYLTAPFQALRASQSIRELTGTKFKLAPGFVKKVLGVRCRGGMQEANRYMDCAERELLGTGFLAASVS